MNSQHPTRRAGRPRKLTGALRNRLLALIRSGVAASRAARMAGIHEDTLGRWCRALPDFAASLEAAREESSGFLERQIAQASRRDWRAAAWLLERRHPEEYGAPAVRTTVGITFEGALAIVEARRRDVAAPVVELPAPAQPEPDGGRPGLPPAEPCAVEDGPTFDALIK